jgi:hypothetical protein
LLPVYSLLFPALASSFQVLIKVLNPLWVDTCMDLVAAFIRWMYSFPSNICWRGCLFSPICFWHICKILGWCICVNSYLGLLFCSTGLHIRFCVSTMLFLLLWLCSIVWSWVLWYLQCCSFCSVLPWLFVFQTEF